MLFVCKVELRGGGVVEIEPVEEKSLESAKVYYKNYVDYWGKVWFGWKGAEIVSVEEMAVDKCL